MMRTADLPDELRDQLDGARAAAEPTRSFAIAVVCIKSPL